MKTHARIGAEIIGDDKSPLLQLAHRIALYHHEKWEGSDYLQGLKGEAISIKARIVAIADVFDALTSLRPYKRAWPVDEAVAYILEQSGTHFDPDMVAAFNRALPKIVAVRAELLDPVN